jgi:hypothetical protein
MPKMKGRTLDANCSGTALVLAARPFSQPQVSWAVSIEREPMFNKIALAAIAAGLWANAMAAFVARPAHANTGAEMETLTRELEAIYESVTNIKDNVYTTGVITGKITDGTCSNKSYAKQRL